MFPLSLLMRPQHNTLSGPTLSLSASGYLWQALLLTKRSMEA